jgi:hypothetical protein
MVGVAAGVFVIGYFKVRYQNKIKLENEIKRKNPA